LHEIWPQAPIYTAVYDQENAKWAKNFTVRPSWLQKLPFAKAHHQWLSLLTPHAFASFDFSQFDIVLSITSAEAKFINTDPGTKHICYCLTPTRYLWSQKDDYGKQGIAGKVLTITSPISRIKDYQAAAQIDHFISISTYVKNQVKKYYGRESEVIYPPVEIKQLKTQKPTVNDYYLVVSRLVSYKKIDLAIAACNKLNKKLVIVGKGSQEKKLRQISSNKIKFVGQLTDEQLAGYYMYCKALIFPGKEDFGIVPVEAQAYGKPVIAYGKGGILDTVIDGETGVFFEKQTVSSLCRTIEKFEKLNFSLQVCKQTALKFSKIRFKQKIETEINNIYNKHTSISM